MIKNISSLIKSGLARKSGVYTLTSIFEKAIPFFLLPVLTLYLTTEEYGIVSMFIVLVGLVTPFTGLGIKPAVLRSYFKEDVDFPSYVSNALLILIFSSTFVLILFVIFSDLISIYAGFPSDWLVTVVIVSVFQFLINIILVIWQAQTDAIKYGIFKISVTALNMGLSVFLIVYLGYGWEGRVIGQVFAVAFFGFIGLVLLIKEGLIKLNFEKKYVIHALKYGIPLIPHILSVYAIQMIDRFFITNMVGISETGIYTVGYQVGMIIGVLAGAFNKAWTPWLYNKLNVGGERIKKKLVKITYGYIFIILVSAFLLALVAPKFFRIFIGAEFYDAINFVIWIAFGYAFKGMYFMVTNYIFYVEKTHILSWLTLFSAISNIVLNYFFIKNFGAIGAAQATSLTYLLQFIITWIVANKVYPMPWLKIVNVK